MTADDIEVIHMTALEWDQALTNSLRDIGLTWAQLTEQAKMGVFTSLRARHLWLMAAGQGPSEAPDPGNLPKRMADVLRVAFGQWVNLDSETNSPEVGEHFAIAALGVRDGLVAWLAGRADRAEAKVEHAEEGAQVASERLAKARQELAELKRVTDPPADDEGMPADPAELREMWEFINRQARWQWHMATKFNDRQERERQRAEAAEAKLNEIAMVKVWTNEDGKRFVFADDLANILLGSQAETTTTPAWETA